MEGLLVLIENNLEVSAFIFQDTKNNICLRFIGLLLAIGARFLILNSNLALFSSRFSPLPS